MPNRCNPSIARFWLKAYPINAIGLEKYHTMNILLVANGYPPTAVGGVETYVAELARLLARSDNQVSVFCRESDFSKADYSITTQILEQVKTTCVVNDYKQVHSFRQTFIDPHLEKIFTDLIELERPDLIHFNHLVGLSARLPIIASEHKIPAIITLHDFWTICHRVKLVDWRGRTCPGPLHGVNCSACVMGGTLRQKVSPLIGKSARAIKRFLPAQLRRSMRASIPGGEDQPPALVSTAQIFAERLALFTQALLATQRLLVPSEYVRTQFYNNGIPRQRIEVVPLGVTTHAGNKPPKRHLNLLTFAAIGPLQPIKGMDTAIKAFSKVPGNHLRLKIYGRSDLYPRNYVQHIIELAQADSRVALMGPYNPADKAAVFDSFDILLVPSPAPETFSLVAHEALALGKPVLATRIGALSEIIQDGINGYLFEPGNQAQLAELIDAFAANPALLESLTAPGAVAIRTAEEHAQQVENIYRQVLGESNQYTSPALD